jgi:hypothetical protein
MAIDLTRIIQTYLADETMLDSWRNIASQRDASIPRLQGIVQQFIDQELDLATFRDTIDRSLRNDPANKYDDWGARGTGFLMELNKLPKHHPSPSTEQELRRMLDGLNATSVGERIGQFYTFLQTQKQLFRQEKLSPNAAMAPGNTAFFVSLFAFWLDREGSPYICYPSLRQGIKILIEYGLVPSVPGLSMYADKISISTESDYRALQTMLDALVTAAPELQVSGIEGYWAEAFFYWLNDHITELIQEPDGIIDLVIVKEPERQTIAHAPLVPTAEPLLAQRIADIQRRLLIDEATLRRIYYALLAGHVILTGPPGTGKTELARVLPELFWQSEEIHDASLNTTALTAKNASSSAYTATVVTATDEWSVRTLIGGLVPHTDVTGHIRYRIQPGHLTRALLDNWALNFDRPVGWNNPGRVTLRAYSAAHGDEREFRGRWLVIDEFNRAPIDIALGEALTSLGSGETLRVPVDGGSAELPIPHDFRIIGTLNSFDRTYLNRISEALKRRFTFVTIDPPTRQYRIQEQAIALTKALRSLAHFGSSIDLSSKDTVAWGTVVTSHAQPDGSYTIDWGSGATALQPVFSAAWNVFEVIRLYRQLGTAQAIGLIKQMLIPGILQGYTSDQQWAQALDIALCDTIADQLQVLLPDEIDSLLLYLNSWRNQSVTVQDYNLLLQNLGERRRQAQLEALSLVVANDGNPYISDNEVSTLLQDPHPHVNPDHLNTIFHLDEPGYGLPLFTRRLRAFKAERGL